MDLRSVTTNKSIYLPQEMDENQFGSIGLRRPEIILLEWTGPASLTFQSLIATLPWPRRKWAPSSSASCTSSAPEVSSVYLLCRSSPFLRIFTFQVQNILFDLFRLSDLHQGNQPLARLRAKGRRRDDRRNESDDA